MFCSIATTWTDNFPGRHLLISHNRLLVVSSGLFLQATPRFIVLQSWEHFNRSINPKATTTLQYYEPRRRSRQAVHLRARAGSGQQAHKIKRRKGNQRLLTGPKRRRMISYKPGGRSIASSLVPPTENGYRYGTKSTPRTRVWQWKNPTPGKETTEKPGVWI